ncbi:hypothetical protein F2Q69_00012822 [Brassica cretica]|uniref:Maf-like protein n=1 Tax=Brassica cretica TaxID=69181 RepID=A0A8S9R686_BRACR|nr:hypothetical protein F2Q69_00012822 [Brassica cretica]
MESDRPPHFKVILGSSSIARRSILTDMGYQFTLMSADIDEKSIRKEKPEELVLALAEAKAEAITQRIPDDVEDKPTLLVTCDQDCKQLRLLVGKVVHRSLQTKDRPLENLVVVYEDAVREKPSSVEEAREYIRSYSKGRTATVSSVVVTNLKTGFRKGGVDRVEIYFNEISEEIIEKLIEEGMVLRVAGALLIEHPLILPCVKEVVGTTDSVMGLPKPLTEKLLKEVLATT